MLFCRLALKGPAKCRFLITLLPLSSSQVGGFSVRPCRGIVPGKVHSAHSCVYGGLDLHLRPIWHQSCCNSGISLSCRLIRNQSCGNGGVSLRSSLVRDQGGCNRGIGLGNAISVTGQAQRKVVVLQADAEGRIEMEVAQGVGSQEQVPGDFARWPTAGSFPQQ